MPSPKKVAWAQLRVGVMAATALILVGIIVFLITGTTGFFSDNEVIYTFMGDSAAMTVGQPVRLNGILIGKIGKVGLSGDTSPRRIVRLDLEVDQRTLTQIPTDSIAAVSAENVLGTKYINIKKGASATTIRPGGELPSKDTSEFDDVVASGYALLTSLQGMLKRIDGIVSLIEAGKGSLGKLLVDETLYNNLTNTVGEAHKITAALNAGKGTVGRLLYDDALYEELSSSAARLDNLLQEAQEGQGTLGKLLKDPSLHDEFKKTVAELRQVIADLNAGKGTAGKFLKSEELHQQVARALGKMDTMMDKVNTGQGTLGQLVANPQLYESMNGATRELQALLKDFRANPKKFLRIKLGLF